LFGKADAHFNAQLTELDLSGNRLAYPAAVSLARFAQLAYRERTVRLASLSLQDNRLGPKWPDADALVAEADLEHYNLGGTGPVENVAFGVRLVLAHLARLATLTHLNLAANMIGWESAEAIETFLEKSSSIKVLILSWNDLSAKGATFIARALEYVVPLLFGLACLRACLERRAGAHSPPRPCISYRSIR
jgi:Ran GTPase-activating protein (RanGAP) involved in mRNA processing and transport